MSELHESAIQEIINVLDARFDNQISEGDWEIWCIARAAQDPENREEILACYCPLLQDEAELCEYHKTKEQSND